MNINRLCTFGYFDRIIVDGYTMPIYNGKGIELKQDESLIEAANNNSNSYDQGIGKLRLTVYGEADFNMSDDNLLNMRFHREQELGLARIKIGNTDRYAIAYADILLLKSENNIQDINTNKQLEDIIKQAKSEDESYLLSKALEVQRKDTKKYKNSLCNVAIVDKVYVNKAFRGCKISSWLHDNIKDIVKTFGMTDISASLLMPGDFSGESRLFRMDALEYKVFLANHYKKHGYVFIDKCIMYKDLKDKSNKFIE